MSSKNSGILGIFSINCKCFLCLPSDALSCIPACSLAFFALLLLLLFYIIRIIILLI